MPSFWEGLCAGKSGAERITHVNIEGLACQISAPAYDFDPLAHFDKKTARKNERFALFAMVSAREALKDAGLEVTEENRERFGVQVGCGIGGNVNGMDDR